MALARVKANTMAAHHSAVTLVKWVSRGLRMNRLIQSDVGSAWGPVDLVAEDFQLPGTYQGTLGGIIHFVYFHFSSGIVTCCWHFVCVCVKCSGIVEIHLYVLPRQPVAIALHTKAI